MKNIIAIHTTLANIDDARKIAMILMDQKLIACAQISSPMESIYRWQDKLETAIEYTLTVKTTEDAAQQVIAVIENNHPYDVPEVVGQRLTFSAKNYQQWLEAEVKYD
ncbi:divalent-cation tolerance protein CutA [Desulforhopalus sp. IMCC35007]|uniref:divalent-cation tolerance protein CutA n=1 Tax=Desulforhopalus sp. IMCC35007 TaxID=2569543 RepID=UPI0010AE5589|nr:divalent-cation tolerance protein CutA [Desulforhopalus sp. IMCC35007]TKB11125.1 divalent-cation tolerance protein CutA [Desulforhopalus sp. IMCC35007]